MPLVRPIDALLLEWGQSSFAGASLCLSWPQAPKPGVRSQRPFQYIFIYFKQHCVTEQIRRPNGALTCSFKSNNMQTMHMHVQLKWLIPLLPETKQVSIAKVGRSGIDTTLFMITKTQENIPYSVFNNARIIPFAPTIFQITNVKVETKIDNKH